MARQFFCPVAYLLLTHRYGLHEEVRHSSICPRTTTDSRCAPQVVVATAQHGPHHSCGNHRCLIRGSNAVGAPLATACTKRQRTGSESRNHSAALAEDFMAPVGLTANQLAPSLFRHERRGLDGASGRLRSANGARQTRHQRARRTNSGPLAPNLSTPSTRSKSMITATPLRSGSAPCSRSGALSNTFERS